MHTIAYHTLGCKVNQYETEKIRESLESAGFRTVPFSSHADVYVINTCTVTGVADAKSRAAVRRALRSNPNGYVIVTGCYAELEPGQVAVIEGVDLIVPNTEKDTIIERITAHLTGSQSVLYFPPHPHPLPPKGEREIGNPRSIRPRTRTRAAVKVQDGCDQFCSYCVVPYARSGKRSRPLGDALAELRSLAEFGYKEVVLTGIRLGSYDDGGNRLPELIRAACAIDGIDRIRLSSIEPWEVDDSLLDAMCSPKVCRHLHIPLQSGDDDVLHRMNRPYDSTRYMQIVSRVREIIPGIGITTDVIVGFPGESDEAFENTRRRIESIGFSRIHVFRYSQRKRTAAAEMDGQVDSKVKKLRSENLIDVGRAAMSRFAESMIGETAYVLVEGRKGLDKVLAGYADNYVEVIFPGDGSLAGQIVEVEITGTDEGKAIGCVNPIINH